MNLYTTMFVCGLWTLVASTNPQCRGAELFVDYNTLTFSPVRRFPLGQLKKNKYASMYVEGQVAKVAWSDKVQYEVQSDLLPTRTWTGATGEPCSTPCSYWCMG